MASRWLLCAALGLCAAGTGCTVPQPLFDASRLDGGRRDAPASELLDVPGADVPGEDAPGLDAPALDAPASVLDAPVALDAPVGTDVPLRALGAACGGASDCASGRCVDGVCCSTACNSPCVACATSLTGMASGTCAPVTAGTDPGDDCASTSAATCGTTGACDGSGGCARHASGTTCVASSCVGTAETPARTCNGTGTCAPPVSVPCSPYRCGATSCLRSCTSSADCVSPAVCVGSACVVPQANGTACTSGAQCTSGFCVDGFCCNTSCTGLCRSCDGMFTLTGTRGTCEGIDCADPDNECPAVCRGTVCGSALSC